MCAIWFGLFAPVKGEFAGNNLARRAVPRPNQQAEGEGDSESGSDFPPVIEMNETRAGSGDFERSGRACLDASATAPAFRGLIAFTIAASSSERVRNARHRDDGFVARRDRFPVNILHRGAGLETLADGF